MVGKSDPGDYNFSVDSLVDNKWKSQNAKHTAPKNLLSAGPECISHHENLLKSCL